MPEFATECDRVDLMAQKLAASVTSDILDAFGFRDQVMGRTIRPLFSPALVVGRAMPILYTEVFEVPEKPYQMDMEGVDSLKPDDVLGPDASATAETTFWGGALSAVANARGACGVVIEGITRDVKHSASGAFPVFASRCVIVCGGVLVEPGDLVFGDADGAVMIPQGVIAGTVHAALT